MFAFGVIMAIALLPLIYLALLWWAWVQVITEGEHLD